MPLILFAIISTRKNSRPQCAVNLKRDGCGYVSTLHHFSVGPYFQAL
jgi:hypothetical protein